MYKCKAGNGRCRNYYCVDSCLLVSTCELNLIKQGMISITADVGAAREYLLYLISSKCTKEGCSCKKAGNCCSFICKHGIGSAYESFAEPNIRKRTWMTNETDLSIVEYMGFSAGYKVMERLTREWPRFKDELDTMKFICTDFWTCIYRKQIDNLRTNHQGVYVLQDNSFRFLSTFSAGQQYLEYAPRYVAFTCGLIRGGLANLCINSVVTAEVQSMPSCKFHIHVQRS